MSEQWLPVVGYEGLYDVSDHGRVWSRPRWVPSPRGWMHRVYGRLLTPMPQPDDGRLHVGLSRNGRSRQNQVHKLVLTAFVGPCPPGLVCCHNDGNNQNNHISNLRWDTRTSNSNDMLLHGTNHYVNRKTCPRDHELRFPNLVPSVWKKHGHRACRACAGAHQAAYQARLRGVEFDFVADANRRYAKIMTRDVP